MIKNPPEYQDYHNFLALNVVTPFYDKRLAELKKMSLGGVLKSKNPYMLKAKGLATPHDLVRAVVDAFLSSQEETMFGNLLENFAVYVSSRLDGGFKPQGRPSIDLEFERAGRYHIVSIKSGTNWGNSDQINGMKNNFKAAKAALRESGVAKEIVAVNGCIYGREPRPLKDKKRVRVAGKLVVLDEEADKVYYKYAGQAFWHFISGDDSLYQEIIRPIDKEARLRNETFTKTYTGKINEMALEFGQHFLDAEGQIDWIKLIDYVSQREAPALSLSGGRRAAARKSFNPS